MRNLRLHFPGIPSSSAIACQVCVSVRFSRQTHALYMKMLMFGSSIFRTVRIVQQLVWCAYYSSTAVHQPLHSWTQKRRSSSHSQLRKLEIWVVAPRGLVAGLPRSQRLFRKDMHRCIMRHFWRRQPAYSVGHRLRYAPQEVLCFVRV